MPTGGVSHACRGEATPRPRRHELVVPAPERGAARRGAVSGRLPTRRSGCRIQAPGRVLLPEKEERRPGATEVLARRCRARANSNSGTERTKPSAIRVTSPSNCSACALAPLRRASHSSAHRDVTVARLGRRSTPGSGPATLLNGGASSPSGHRHGPAVRTHCQSRPQRIGSAADGLFVEVSLKVATRCSSRRVPPPRASTSPPVPAVTAAAASRRPTAQGQCAGWSS